MISPQKIRGFATKVGKAFSPERIILFGSYAYGKPNPDSDVDILVVMPYQGSPVYVAADIVLKTKPGFPVDLIVRTSECLRKRLEMGDCFIQEIISKGKLLFETSRP